ncbi:plasmid pRiA4b ORF-3 family protein [Rossellomorea vietnamensis]|uniref:Plasmid pRiA4b ORF-3 family protein n=1 Tax=Rossellomorea vietnamensis TaxID=218284 RepID=A0A5D4KFC7_9BACI|nr:plasmid pRiA4b ORF-3 family protein [Rossellomorea vietnamensis]TYR75987.1 plasmid pRiA4b ORF-3 family protein [Rossellomorea vietnamensis]
MDLKHILNEVAERIKKSEEYKQLDKEEQQRFEQMVNPDLLSLISGGDVPAVDYSAQTNGKALQLKVSLKGAKPPIWRRLLVSDILTLHQLHEVIQAAMGWTNFHLYDFQYGDVYFEEMEEEVEQSSSNFRKIHESKEALIGNVLVKEGQKLEYTYDFSNNWEHTILLEKIEDKEAAEPICLKGRRATPPEAVGGVHNYMHVLKLLDDPAAQGEKVEFYRDLLQGQDPGHFDLEETNEELRKSLDSKRFSL